MKHQFTSCIFEDATSFVSRHMLFFFKKKKKFKKCPFKEQQPFHVLILPCADWPALGDMLPVDVYSLGKIPRSKASIWPAGVDCYGLFPSREKLYELCHLASEVYLWEYPLHDFQNSVWIFTLDLSFNTVLIFHLKSFHVRAIYYSCKLM